MHRLRKKNFSTRRSSLFWRGFVQVLSLLGTCLTWKVGDGNNILLGIDPIIGVKNPYLPEDLRSYLEYLDICTLGQARNTHFPAMSYWLTADELYLGGSYYDIWNNFIHELYGAGIHLSGRPDTLLDSSRLTWYSISMCCI